MAAIAGYHITWQYDRGDAWQNAVDPWIEQGIAHKECAWNHGDLRHDCDEVIDLERISYEEAAQQNITCCYCELLLTVKRYYSFQACEIAS